MVYVCRECGSAIMKEYIHEGRALCFHCYNKFVNNQEGATIEKLKNQVEYLTDIIKRLTQDYSNLTTKVDTMSKELNNIKTELRKVKK